MSDETYHRVYASIWREPWTEDQRHLALYLLTCEHRKFEGIYRLPLAYACEDLGWPRGKVRSNLRSLEDLDFARYDDQAQVVWVVKALKRQRPNGNQAKSAARKVLSLPQSSLLEDFRKACETLSPVLAEAIAEEIGTPGSHSKLPSFNHPLSPPQAGETEPFPSPPSGKRKTERVAFEVACRNLAADLFPDANVLDAAAVTEGAITAGGATSPEAVRAFVATHRPDLAERAA